MLIQPCVLIALVACSTIPVVDGDKNLRRLKKNKGTKKHKKGTSSMEVSSSESTLMLSDNVLTTNVSVLFDGTIKSPYVQ